MNLPRLELAEIVSGLDEAVITINGREEDQLTVACEGSLELANRLIRYVNAHGQIIEALSAAAACLRHFDTPPLEPHARSLAAHCETLIEQIGAAA